MIDIVTDNHYALVLSLFENSLKEIRIISPFLSKKMADLLCNAANRGVRCSFITRMYLQDFLDGSNTLDGLQNMLDAGVQLYALIGLHTKLYLFDEYDAILGSANFTEGGLSRNIELSVHFKDEDVTQHRLNSYYIELLNEIEKSEDGVINQELINEYKELYIKKHQQNNNLTGGIGVVSIVRGAALDRKARAIKNNPNEAFDEIQASIGERNTDAVYGALGGELEKVTHKQLNNILLKFSASAKDRFDGNKPMEMVAIEENGRRFYISNFSAASEKRAKSVEDLDETFFCVHSYDKSGKHSPMIVGKGFLRQYNSKNDARKKAWFRKYQWLEEYPYYCIIDEANILNAPVNCGIPLLEVIDALGYKAYMHTKDKPEEYPKEKVAKSHQQRVMLNLTPEAKTYIDNRLKELGEKYGCVTYKSEL